MSLGNDVPDQGTSLRRRFDAWQYPFVFLLYLPIITIPATATLRWITSLSCPTQMFAEYESPRCPTELVVLTLAPGLAGLLCFAWLTSESFVVRKAAAIAGLLAIVRLLAPASVLLLQGPTTLLVFRVWPQSLDAFASFALWCVTLVTLEAFRWWTLPTMR
jgi:hypothetical protein